MNLDRCLAGERGADFLANVQQVRALLVERGVDELPEKSFDVLRNEFRWDAGDGEGVAGEALDVEADGAQLVEMRLEERRFGEARFVEDRREQLLCGRRVALDALPVTVVEDPLVGHVLVDEAESAGRVDEDVAKPVLADDATLKVAEAGRASFPARRPAPAAPTAREAAAGRRDRAERGVKAA